MLIDTAEQASQTRQAANHRHVLDNLNAVIDSLEVIEQEPTA